VSPSPIYLDYAATTPVDHAVAQAMSDCLTVEGHFGNPSSAHAYGRAATARIAQARAQLRRNERPAIPYTLSDMAADHFEGAPAAIQAARIAHSWSVICVTLPGGMACDRTALISIRRA